MSGCLLSLLLLCLYIGFRECLGQCAMQGSKEAFIPYYVPNEVGVESDYAVAYCGNSGWSNESIRNPQSITCEENMCCKTKTLTNTNAVCCLDNEECCETDSQFTCCETPKTKTLREQLQLWGTVVALAVFIGLFIFCCKNDASLCNGDDRTFAQRIGLGRRQQVITTPLSHPGDRYSSAVTNRNSYSALPPLPPMTPYMLKSSYGGRPAGEESGGLYPSLGNKAGYHGRSNSGYLDDDDYRY